ncbi:MAG: sialate O-acetylesterase [Phycisphaerales bacterium]
MRYPALFLAVCIALLALAPPASAQRGPLKVFILAGQSNMEGQAVADLDGPHYNDGKGTLAFFLQDAAKKQSFSHLVDENGAWRKRPDVWVRYQPEHKPLRAGPLTVGFTPYDGAHHFGPELQFGNIVGDALENPVLLIKTAWGGKSLYVDFRPPSSGGATGPYYTMMIQQVRDTLANLKTELPGIQADGYELAGFVWYHGWNDGCDPAHAVPEYKTNLINLIKDVRKDLGAPTLPVVIGELTGPWVDAPKEWGALRRAQADAANQPDFAGNVIFVPTHDFVRRPEDSPNPTHAHHEFGNAETYFLVGDALGKGMLDLLKAQPSPAPPDPAVQVVTHPAEMAGYMLVPLERAPDEYNAGFSLYAAAWPLLKHYPGHRFQTGLFGTWMHAQYSGPAPKDAYSDIEGGLGWWRDTRFPTETPKFIMGGVAVNFGEIANGPAHGIGTWDDPKGLYGVAQISPWLLFPIDGLNIKQGTCGELFGYGYLPLPLLPAKSQTAGAPIPTGDHCWTLFLNTNNFKGPICFFTPYFWSRSSLKRTDLAGLLLDSRPSDPNKAFQMETQYVPGVIAAEQREGAFARVAPMYFPADAQGRSVVLHQLTCYSKRALWDAAKAWFAGGAEPTQAIDPAGAFVQRFRDGGGSTWRLYPDGAKDDARTPIDWKLFGTPTAIDPTTYGYTWKAPLVQKIEHPGNSRVMLPEYFRLITEGAKQRWTPVDSKDVPASFGLSDLRFDRPAEPAPEPYDTPTNPTSSFKTPGPVAGPFQAHLGDGSVVTYYWYRFADQPAMLNADLTDQEREQAQKKIELMHRAWTRERQYLAPPTVGSLADLDPAQIVTPPKGFEIGYVPIATRQEQDPAGRKPATRR